MRVGCGLQCLTACAGANAAESAVAAEGWLAQAPFSVQTPSPPGALRLPTLRLPLHRLGCVSLDAEAHPKR